MNVFKCAGCQKWFGSAGWYAKDAPREPASGGMSIGRIVRSYADSNPPRWCSEECRDNPDSPRS